MNTHYITLPFSEQELENVKSGDLIYLSGYIYTARDAAHARLIKNQKKGNFDINLSGEVVYYVGPTPSFDDHIVGSAGPTTSSRMDRFTPQLMDAGLVGTIGKGNRSQDIVESCKKNKGLYLVTTGGVGALLSNQIVSYEEIMYKDLGVESIKRLKIEDFPVYVAYDIYGNDIFKKN